VIHQRAEELGRLIGQTDEYKALRHAQDLVQEARELGGQLRQQQQLAAALETAM
jgi:cell fate (sporulation/competence/biofilm development) regulator YlbF (YheA/YmcA/DUF963 family)